MKKAILVLLVMVCCVFVAGAADMAAEENNAPAAESIGLTLRANGALTLGLGDYIRGGGLNVQVLYKLFNFITIGLDVTAEYDAWFNCFEFPVSLVLGRNVQILVGYIFAAPTPSIEISDGSSLEYRFTGFPDYFGLAYGSRLFDSPNGLLSIEWFSRIVYTSTVPVDNSDTLLASLGMLAGFLYNLKAYAGIGVSFNF